MSGEGLDDQLREALNLTPRQARGAGLREALFLVEAFRAAYPLDVFPWPQEAPSRDAIGAQMARHVCDRLARSIRERLGEAP